MYCNCLFSRLWRHKPWKSILEGKSPTLMSWDVATYLHLLVCFMKVSFSGIFNQSIVLISTSIPKKSLKNMEIYTKLCFLDTYFDLKDYCQLKLAINLPYMLFTVKPMFTATYFYPYHPNPGRREKINLNFNFHTFLWCLKRFYEGLKGLHKTFWGTTKKCENNLN